MQACAKMLLGQQPIEIPAFYHAADAPCKHAVACLKEPGRPPLYWHPDFFEDQWFIDAFTVDPHELLDDRTGIWPRGVERPPQQCNLVNASLGSLPKVQVYIAVHQQFGTLAFYPYHGAKHGGRSEKKDERMYEGYVYWTSALSKESKEQIRDRGYYNFQAAMEALKKDGTAAEWREFTGGEFHPRHFMVRVPPLLPMQATPNPNPACCRARASSVCAIASPSARPSCSCWRPHA